MQACDAHANDILERNVANSDSEIKELLSIREDEEISQQITGALKDSFTILLYFQHSCLKVISGNWHHRVLIEFWCWCVNGSNMDKRWKAIACENSRCGAFRGKVTHQYYSNLKGFMCFMCPMWTVFEILFKIKFCNGWFTVKLCG